MPVIAHIPSAMQEHKFVSHSRPSPTKRLSSTPHPLDQLSSHEIDIAREAIFAARGKCLILFRAIFTEEPAKAELVPFLEAEHSGTLTSSAPRPARQARVQYDIVHDDKSHDYMESVVDILAKQEVAHRIIDKKHQSALTLYVSHQLCARVPTNVRREEFKAFQDACVKSPLYKEAISQFDLPEGFEVTIDPW